MSESVKFPIGTRIRFLKTLTCPPTSEHPGFHYATKGDSGHVTGHDCREGHWVKWEGWTHAAFGAELGVDFEAFDNTK
jgi:hypothetical protein